MASQASPINPVYPVNYVKDYTTLLIKALRRWFNAAIEQIKQYIRSVRDAAIDDLFARLNEMWEQEVQGLSSAIRDIFRRLSATHLDWWVRALSYATGVEATVFLALMPEPWAQEEIDSRTDTNVVSLLAIGALLLSSLGGSLRNGLRSGLTLGAISKAMQAALENAEGRVTFLARNQIEEHQASINQQRQQDADTEGYYWLETTSLRPRKHHLARVGKFFYWNKPPEDGHPGHAPNCKCGARPALPDSVYGFRVIRKN